MDVMELPPLSRQVVSQLELRRNLADFTSTTTECKRSEAALRQAIAENL